MNDFLKATSMDHVNMNVKNLTQSVEFYKNLFGFEIRKADNSPNKLDVPSQIIGNDSIKLCLYEDPQMSTSGGIAHFGFHIANFDQIMEKTAKYAQKLTELLIIQQGSCVKKQVR